MARQPAETEIVEGIAFYFGVGDLDGQRVDDFNAFDVVEVGLAGGLDELAGDGVIGEFEVVGCDLLAVGPHYAVLQIECPHEAILGYIPARGHLCGDDGAAEGVLSEQAGEEPAEDVKAGAVRGQDWVEDRGVCAGTLDPDAALDRRPRHRIFRYLFGLCFGSRLWFGRSDWSGLRAGCQDQCGHQEHCQERQSLIYHFEISNDELGRSNLQTWTPEQIRLIGNRLLSLWPPMIQQWRQMGRQYRPARMDTLRRHPVRQTQYWHAIAKGNSSMVAFS